MKGRVTLIGLLFWTAVSVEGLEGHGVLGRVVQHHIMVTAGKSYMDVTVELTFHSVFAQRERERMDANRDGVIEADEGKQYLHGILPMLETGLRMIAGKREIVLTLLHHPELDLLGNEGAGSHPLRVSVFYVTRLDHELRRTSVIDLENRLWLEAPALCSLELRSRGGSSRVGRRLSSLFEPGSEKRRLSLELSPVSTSAPR